jgi:hypothetical protein
MDPVRSLEMQLLEGIGREFVLSDMHVSVGTGVAADPPSSRVDSSLI